MSEENTLKLASVDYVDSMKAKTWFCTFDKTEAGCCFNSLGVFEQSGMDSYRSYDDNDIIGIKAIIKFTKEKSLTEVNKWLMFEAKLNYGSDGGEPVGDSALFNVYTPFAVCPWPEDKPWPEAN